MKEEIIALIDNYIRSEEKPADMRALAKAQNALPIYLDMGGCILLRPDKTFILHPGDTKEFNREDNPAWHIVALVYGSRRYPSLVSLLPFRDVDARDCQTCKSTGCLVAFNKIYEKALCGKCFGLGWVDSYIESLKL